VNNSERQDPQNYMLSSRHPHNLMVSQAYGNALNSSQIYSQANSDELDDDSLHYSNNLSSPTKYQD